MKACRYFDQLLKLWSQTEQLDGKAEKVLGKLLCHFRHCSIEHNSTKKEVALLKHLIEACAKTRNRHSDAYYYHESVEVMLRHFVREKK